MKRLQERVFVVPRKFRVNALPSQSHLEYYTLIHPGHVLVEGKGKTPTSVFFDKKAGKLVCHCSCAKLLGDCAHQQALLNGLGAKLAAPSQNKSLLTCTQDWCKDVPLQVQPLPFGGPFQNALAY